MSTPFTCDFNTDDAKTLGDFMQCDDYVRGAQGPFGSGKSSACVLECVRRAIQQKPWKDNVRRSRVAVIRNSYPMLRSTTIKTWQKWIPQSLCPITFGSPISGMLKFSLSDKTRVEMETYFIALDQPKDIAKLLSLDLSFAWINEAREIGKDIVDAVTGRLRRYPSKDMGGPLWTGLMMDTNPPDQDHWWYRLFEEEKPQGWSLFKQPGALIRVPGGYIPNNEAENIKHLNGGYKYYLDMIAGKSEDWIKVYVLGEYGVVMEGKPVFPEYQDSRHVAKADNKPMRGLPAILAFDFGLTPCCLFLQYTPKGQMIVLDELCSKDMGIRQFAAEVVKPFIFNNYTGMVFKNVGDPAGATKAQTDERTCFDELKAAGLQADPAPTNSFIARREAVATLMNRRVKDGEKEIPGLLINPKCIILRKALAGKYCYKRVQASGQERFQDVPDKTHPWSDIVDCLQYGALTVDAPYVVNAQGDPAGAPVKLEQAGWGGFL